MARKNHLVVPESEAVLHKFRNEVAAELGYPNYEDMDKGELPARIHGMIGGTITKRLIQLGEQSLREGKANL